MTIQLTFSGPYSIFETPQKSSFPTLDAPNSKPFYFSDVPPQPDASQFRTPSFTKPRIPLDYDFSSGPENSSPAEQADNEDTPEAKRLATELNCDETTPSKRNSLFNFYGKYAPTSAGRGEIPKKLYSNGVVKRMHKRRRRAQNFEKQLALGRRPSEDSSEEDAGPSQNEPKHPPPLQEIGWMTGLFTFIHTYPDAPSIIAKYLQVFFNAAILAGCLYMFCSFYATIQADVNRASEDAKAEVLAEMATCTKNYIDNRCGANNRLPALETVCSNWELCMSRDPSAVKRARLSAHTFAEIFNSFVEPISLKTM
jgi:Di-sulfide bridge nucleocytoplasmic transport domain